MTESSIVLGWVLPLFIGYAALHTQYNCFRSTPKSDFWPAVGGAASFLFFNSVWDFTQGVADLISESLGGIVDVDSVRMVMCPLVIAIAIEVLGSFFLFRVQNARSPVTKQSV
ncbi:hypothetical protein LOC67_17120 [Stieleria sp. JC731]|uniref:hypothetical protein n=1 Tax=Pirellulaceae TaxID=2691357 RepID=UPI001E5B75A3|nr:hypothetical protein [Stieleria sp. JC731]MCC9602278.1 hypothetical protein [Stieleria sp. JC731]